MKVNIVTLGCSKNLVDTERLMGMLGREGFECAHNPTDVERGDIVVVNTCGFIADAKEESINTILEYCRLRTEGHIAELHVMGCLSQRYPDQLRAEIPEIDRLWGKFDWPGLINDLSSRYKAVTCAAAPVRVLTTPHHYAYIKISEGCNRHCAFCAIPGITGTFTSRPEAEVLEEVRQLAATGTTEFNVIAQDLSAYGEDLTPDHTNRLAALIDQMASIDGVRRIRLHYAYPTRFPRELLDVMASHPNICRYLDIALQHSSDNMLRRMHRHISSAEQKELLDEIRRRVPGIYIRTTLMVGFPGETEEDFEELMDFVRTQRFERMGAFAYSEEDDTPAARLYTDDVAPEIKQRRLDALMALQEQISAEIQQQKVGEQIEVVIDREEPEWYVGRTEWDSPEVDPEVLISKDIPMTPGEYYTVTVTEALPFELVAKPVKNI